MESSTVPQGDPTAASTVPPAPPQEPQESAQEQDAKFYCPACGRRSDYPRECVGLQNTYGHPAVEMVSTDELRGDDTSQHTPAPPSE